LRGEIKSKLMNTFWGQMGIELLGGTIGSFIFLFIILFWMRPRISIGNMIAKLENTFDKYIEWTTGLCLV
jgi:hypothetical protein